MREVGDKRRFGLCAARITSPIDIFPLYITANALPFPKIPINYYFATVSQVGLAETDKDDGSEVQETERNIKRAR